MNVTRTTLMGLIASAAAVWPLGPALAQTAKEVEGSYCLSGVMEVGSCLKLSAGGTFEYFLAYGAYDETSQGTWKLEGGDVVLDSPPYDKAPRFTFKGRKAGEGGGFDIAVVNKGGQPINGIDVRAACDGHAIEVGVTGTGGHEVKCATAPTEVSLGLGMFGVPFQTIALDGKAGSGNVYVFEFDPGDLGKKRFKGTHLKRKGARALVMTYGGSPIRELEGKPFTYGRE